MTVYAALRVSLLNDDKITDVAKTIPSEDEHGALLWRLQAAGHEH